MARHHLHDRLIDLFIYFSTFSLYFYLLVSAIAAVRNGHHPPTAPVAGAYTRTNARQLPPSPDGHPSPQNDWTSADRWQHSLPRLFHSGGDKMVADSALRPGTDKQPPKRSSSAVPCREAAIDVEFPARVIPLHRPVPKKSHARTISLGNSPPSGPADTVHQLAVDRAPSPKTSLAKKIGNAFRRRSKSATNSRESSPVVGLDLPPRIIDNRTTRKYSTDSNDSAPQDSKDFRSNSKDGKVKSAKRFLPSPFRTKKVEHNTRVEQSLEQKSGKDSSVDSSHPIVSKSCGNSVPVTGNRRQLVRQFSTDESTGKQYYCGYI